MAASALAASPARKAMAPSSAAAKASDGKRLSSASRAELPTEALEEERPKVANASLSEAASSAEEAQRWCGVPPAAFATLMCPCSVVTLVLSGAYSASWISVSPMYVWLAVALYSLALLPVLIENYFAPGLTVLALGCLPWVTMFFLEAVVRRSYGAVVAQVSTFMYGMVLLFFACLVMDRYVVPLVRGGETRLRPATYRGLGLENQRRLVVRTRCRRGMKSAADALADCERRLRKCDDECAKIRRLLNASDARWTEAEEVEIEDLLEHYFQLLVSVRIDSVQSAEVAKKRKEELEKMHDAHLPTDINTYYR